MPEKHLFEYAVIRVVPKVEREEFLNVGVVLYCPIPPFLVARSQLDQRRLHAFCQLCDLAEIEDYLHSFGRICQGDGTAGPISRLPIAERFRWLTATRSTVVQTSKVHSGLSANLEATLARLYAELVLVA